VHDYRPPPLPGRGRRARPPRRDPGRRLLGLQYGLGFDTAPADGDEILDLEGVRVVVDPFSAPYLRGATIDFLNGLQESGFKIDNPNAASSCGCGHSFQVEEGAEPDAHGAAGCGSGCSH
jgi:iron-sulfur cluster assembly protein